MTELQLSELIEELLVAANPRGMRTVSCALTPGYMMRAANMIRQHIGTVLIGTGFPVNNTFETDGPVGAIALYRAIETLGGKPIILCCNPLAEAIKEDFSVYTLARGELSEAPYEASKALTQLNPNLLISIEHPGLTASNDYRNMRGENITDQCSGFDFFLKLADCPSIAIGDGGNEAGMGRIQSALRDLNITPSIVCCDELVIADVSNWAAHGLLACLSYLEQKDLLQDWNNRAVLKYLSDRGSVDGITGKNTLTEDGLDCGTSDYVIEQLKQLAGF